MANTNNTAPAKKKKRRRRKKGMSKQIKLLVILGSVIAALLLVLLVLLPILQNASKPQPNSSSVSIQEPTYFVKTTPNDLKSIEIEDRVNPDDSFTLQRVGQNAFGIPSLKGYEVLSDNINKLAQSLCTVYAMNPIEGAAEKPGDFGLDKPSALLTYAFENGDVTVIEIGDKAPAVSMHYIRVQGSEEIYAVSSLENLLGSATRFVGTTVTDKPAELFNANGSYLTEKKFDTIDLTGTGLPHPLHCEQEDMSNYSKIVATAYDYFITDGTRRSLLNTAIVTEMTGECFFGLVADSVEAVGVTEADLAKYGLDNPYKELSMSKDGKVWTLKCAPAGDGSYYVMKPGFKAVYKVSADKLPWAEYDYLKIASAIVFAPYIDDTQSVELDFGDGERHLFEANCPDLSTNLKVSYNGKEGISPDDYRKFFSLIIYSSADQFLTGDEDLDVDPVLTITYTQETGTVDVVRFLPISARSVAIEHNGNCQFFMRSEFIDKIARELDNLVNGRDVIVEW